MNLKRKKSDQRRNNSSDSDERGEQLGNENKKQTRRQTPTATEDAYKEIQASGAGGTREGADARPCISPVAVAGPSSSNGMSFIFSKVAFLLENHSPIYALNLLSFTKLYGIPHYALYFHSWLSESSQAHFPILRCNFVVTSDRRGRLQLPAELH